MSTERKSNDAEHQFNLLLRGKAYQLFYAELHRSVTEVQEQLSPSVSAGEDSLRTMRRLFHSLKGSSGFFGFRDLHTTVGKLESALENLESSALPSLDATRELLEELERQVKALPTPSNQE